MAKRFEHVVTTIYLGASATVAVLGVVTTLLGLLMLATGWSPQ